MARSSARLHRGTGVAVVAALAMTTLSGCSMPRSTNVAIATDEDGGYTAVVRLCPGETLTKVTISLTNDLIPSTAFVLVPTTAAVQDEIRLDLDTLAGFELTKGDAADLADLAGDFILSAHGALETGDVSDDEGYLVGSVFYDLAPPGSVMPGEGPDFAEPEPFVGTTIPLDTTACGQRSGQGST